MLALAVGNGGSRDWETWEQLFERAGPGFKVKSKKMLLNSETIVIEVGWEGDFV